ncbi:MAG: hypothetical protein K2G60_06375 [Oscillospiraceae bacterium]|nr:hypothetical protein [Oscillospiraceae bacterium]
MKKYFSLLLAAVMLFAASFPAFAATENYISKGDAVQSASPDVFTKTTRENNKDAASYSVTIPAQTEIQWGITGTEFTYRIKSQLEIGKRLNVTVIGENDENKLLNNKVSKPIPYAFSYPNDDGVAESLNYTTAREVVDINRIFTIEIKESDWEAVPIARYADRLTFTVEVVDA